MGPDDARDVTQDALLSAWRELPRLRQTDRFSHWLRAILMNRCRNALRARSRRPTAPLGTDRTGDHSVLWDDPVRGLHRSMAIRDALEVLNPEERAVLTLHYLVDLTMREVAGIVGLREGTAKTRLHSGLEKLRDSMGEEMMAWTTEA